MTASERLAQAQKLDDEIKRLHRRSNAANAEIVAQLFELQLAGGHLALGFASVYAYSWDRLGWRHKKTEELLRLVLRLRELPVLRASFDAGELDWTKAVVAARAAAEEPDKEEQWAEDGKTLPVDELKRKARAVTGEELRVRVVLDLSLEQAAVIQQGDRGLLSEGLKLTREERFVEAYLRMLEGGAVGSSKFRAFVVHDPASGETAVPTPEGNVPLSPELAERVLCRAEVQERKAGVEVVTKEIPASAEREIKRRSKGICEIPSCGLATCELHHLRGRKTSHDPNDVLDLCSGHHTGFHHGSLRARGSWRTGIEITLADGKLVAKVGDAAPDRAGADAETGAHARAETGAHAPAETGAHAPAETGARAPAHDPMQERRDAVRALERLELRAGEARRLLARVLELRPELYAAPAEDLVRAVLLL